ETPLGERRDVMRPGRSDSGHHSGQWLYPVVNPDQTLRSVMTRRELEELLWKRGDEEATYPALDGARLAEFIPAEKKPVVAYPDEPLRVVVYRMAKTGFTRFPVVERRADN